MTQYILPSASWFTSSHLRPDNMLICECSRCFLVTLKAATCRPVCEDVAPRRCHTSCFTGNTEHNHHIRLSVLEHERRPMFHLSEQVCWLLSADDECFLLSISAPSTSYNERSTTGSTKWNVKRLQWRTRGLQTGSQEVLRGRQPCCLCSLH